MARVGALVIAAAGAIASAATARAADPPQKWAPPSVIRTVTPSEAAATGWYLRADAGYRWSMLESATTTTGFPAPTDNRLNNAIAAGVGAGFKWRNLRTDLTADYSFKTTYTGSGGGAAATARIDTATLLGNVYYDIGTWWGLTPYFGAGAGAAVLRVSDWQSVTTPPLSNVDSYNRFNFAWALMAGTSYQLTRNLSVDAGYRFLSQGDAKTAPGAFGGTTLNRLQSHEARIGLRWMYDAPWAYTR
jgi:opacity protein-like surface antigen